MMPPSPLRILYLIDEMPALTAGGTERQLLQMAALMTRSGAEVRIGTLRGSEWLTAKEAGCPVEHFDYRSLWQPSSLRELWRLRRWMRSEQIEILQTFFVESNILGPILGRLASVPVILGSRRNLNYWMSPFSALLQGIANGYSTRLMANSHAVKKYVVETEGVAPEKVDVIYNGLDVTHFAPDPALRSQTRQRYGFTDADVVIGAVSVLRAIKGCETFVAAALEVAQKDPRTRFVLVGDGPLRESLEAAAAPLGDRFRFAGAQEDVRPFLYGFDVGVLASESEGFSNSILEYMAAGLPCVVTDVGGNPEAVDNAGLVVNPKDPASLAAALLQLTGDSALRSTFSQRALQRAQAFSLDSTRLVLAEYYRRLRAND